VPPDVQFPKSFGVIKPDIVFFGQPLPNDFDRFLEEDKQLADLVIVMGSSLKVHPVAGTNTYTSTHSSKCINTYML
jgi:NAD-dependent histone deacetylase SIR2